MWVFLPIWIQFSFQVFELSAYFFLQGLIDELTGSAIRSQLHRGPKVPWIFADDEIPRVEQFPLPLRFVHIAGLRRLFRVYISRFFFFFFFFWGGAGIGGALKEHRTSALGFKTNMSVCHFFFWWFNSRATRRETTHFLVGPPKQKPKKGFPHFETDPKDPIQISFSWSTWSDLPRSFAACARRALGSAEVDSAG